MAISPPSDIVLDVARAADPLRYQEATQRLTQMRAAAGTGSAASAAEAFDALMDETSGETEAAAAPRALSPLLQLPTNPASALTRLANSTALSSATSGIGGATTGADTGTYRSFEAMVLTSFVQTMLPQSSSGLFGSGSAGQIWRSMLAEQIAKQMADSGGVGIADQLQAETRTAPAQKSAGLI
ncbi:rod-binding protein [Afifella sp. IM 167]|uniref:rod-binding protein n=1 Tax=Afifella sp. IM 167 TaxID=2033586 RepID=UPI001CCE6542|nr:rod-binding protein [Afifella sp. IM 167]MBZ8131807.1 hypothetical protein [Afifella sp. IM 167]